ncbi:E3 ubiquitin-protein ligase UBR1 [Thelohanellus kitauei]|uniref:E3 ubiquitin-protein ligase n=1 Tax=Thelohanellus kitauei TaxID=669202 RepID=A0A0C2MHS6_THEKT|nr:E3 ubiquitin-protein ligase UBR1 [Thelohanellus kitauei]
MSNEPSGDEIRIRLDQIVCRALRITSEEQESDPMKVYSETKLYDLVILPIVQFWFEKVDPETKSLYYSNEGSLGRCVKLLTPADKAYVCHDCARDISGLLCEDCFRNSDHVEHNYAPVDQHTIFFCHCGDSEAYENSPPCFEHGIPDVSRRLPQRFVKRIRFIIRHLFKYLELVCGDESSLDTYVEEMLLVNDDLEN